MSRAVYDWNYVPQKPGRAHSPNVLANPNILDVTGRQRDKELWYEDGTVILVAQEVEFRVYKGLLADQSPVFESIFSSSRSSSVDKMEQDCSTFCLTDSPSDLRHIFRACIPGAQLRQVRFRLLPPRICPPGHFNFLPVPFCTTARLSTSSPPLSASARSIR